MEMSPEVDKIGAALAKAQGQMKPAHKDAINPHFKSRYADLAANVEAAREPLAVNGIAVMQEAKTALIDGKPFGISVATMLLHASGQWVKFEPITVPLSKIDAHGVGSATTYARRYALGAALGLVAEDDDGNAASVSADQHQPAPPQKPEGYDVWAAALETTLQEAGADAAREEFKAAKAEYRDYFTKVDSARYQKFKAASGKRAA